MSAYITQLTEQEFQKQTHPDEHDLSVKFQESLFKQKLTFSLPMKKQAMRYCQKLIENNLSSLLVKGTYCFTVWVQETNSLNISTTNKSSTDNNINSSTASVSVETAPKVPTKKITKTYRGQTYEVEIPDYSGIKNIAENNQKSRRKYRGQYID